MYCGNCGKEIAQDMDFCPSCGASVSEQEQTDSFSNLVSRANRATRTH